MEMMSDHRCTPRSLTYPLKSYRNPIGKGSFFNRIFFQGRTGKLLGFIQVQGRWFVMGRIPEEPTKRNHKSNHRITTRKPNEAQKRSTKQQTDTKENKQQPCWFSIIFTDKTCLLHFPSCFCFPSSEKSKIP